jgi:hypothetical protein
MKTLVWILGLAGGWAALTLAMNLPREHRLRRLARSRAGTDNLAAVRKSLPEIPEQVLVNTYRAVQDLMPGKDFPVRADDNLWRTLEIDEGSLGDLIEELVAKPHRTDGDAALGGPIGTFADLARAATGTLTPRWSGPLARMRSQRPLSVSVMRT